MKKHIKRRLLLNFILSFSGFFLLSGIATFISLLMFSHSFEIPFDEIHDFAPFILVNLIVVSLIFGIFGTVWRYSTVEIPVTEISAVLRQIRKGDLKAKLKRRHYTSRYSAIIKNINLMTNELSSIDSLKASILSNISHELKTPVSIINNYATLLSADDISDDKRIEYAASITETSKKMTELITNILKLNQLENQNIPSDIVEYDLSEQLCECLLSFEEIWEEKNIEIEADIEEDVKINSNMQLMSIVWNNLFSNAFKFTPHGGKVSVSVKQTNKYAVVKIADTGIGIEEDKKDLIFEKFYQCDTSHSTDGNGLGLALVKRILNLTNSIIKVESTPGEGTEFTVKIRK